MKRRGFTIVELLIVIVVIAILAAITIVAFNGLQERAQNSARIQAGHQIAKLLNVAVVQHGISIAHVGVTPVAPYCLPTGNSDTNGNGVPDCGLNTGTAYDREEKPAANAMLQAAGVTGISFPDDAIVGVDGKKYRGIHVTYSNNSYGVGGVLQPYFVYFALKGEARDCGSSYSIGPNPGFTDALYALKPAKYYSMGNGMTYCALTVRDPKSV